MRKIARLLVLAALVPAGTAHAAMSADQNGKFIKTCQTQMYESADTCACMAEMAGTGLDDLSIAYLVLPANDVTNAAALAKKMSDAERAAVDHFMATAPKQCRKPG